MARKSVDLCMLCGELPCGCNKPDAPAPKPKATKKVPRSPRRKPATDAAAPSDDSPVATPAPDVHAAMRGRVRTAERVERPAEEGSLRTFIEVFWDVLSSDDQRRFAVWKPSVPTRLTKWKSRVKS